MKRSGSDMGCPLRWFSPAAWTVWNQAGRNWGFLAIAALALALLPFLRSTAPWGTSTLLLLAACALSYPIAARWVRDRFLLWTVLGSLIFRSVLSVGFYLVSLWKIPIFESLQLGEGFWSFAADAPLHHAYAVKIVEAWRDGIELPEGLGKGWYFLVLATAYKLIGIHPLHGVFPNAGVGAGSALVAYSTARRLGGTSAGRVAALLVAFWPSLTLWSTQLLKEQITVFFVLLAIYFAVRIVQEMAALERRRHAWVGHASLLIGATGTVFLIATARPLYALALAFSALLVFGAWALQAFCNRQVYKGGGLILAATFMLSAAFMGKSIDPLYLFSPRAPWVGHFALGVRYLEEGNRHSAEKEFKRSVELNPRFAPAYEKLVPFLAKEEPLADILSNFRQVVREGIPSAQGEEDSVADTGFYTQKKHVLSKIQAPLAQILGFLSQLVEFPKIISSLREGQMAAAGHSQIYPEADLSSFSKIFAYLLKGLVFTFFAPFPWQAFDTGGVAGILKSFSLVESFVIYLLIPFGLSGSWTLICSRNVSGWFLLVYLFIGTTVLALTMVNLGNLFRYRVPFLLALVILASLGGLPEALRRAKVHFGSLLRQVAN